jgi:hypothetical protein
MTEDDDFKPKFQRRRSRDEEAQPMAIATEDAPVPAGQRRRAPKVGTQALKLKAPERPGHTRRFVINTPERIAEMENLGYAIVSDPSTATIGLGSGTVERPAGSGADGSYRKHILMETPNELYAEGQAELERHNRQVDIAIRAGRAFNSPLSPDELSGAGSIEVKR